LILNQPSNLKMSTSTPRTATGLIIQLEAPLNDALCC